MIAVACAVSGAHLGAALLSLGTQSRKALSVHTPKQWPLSSPVGPDFFPDSLMASCGTLAPFRLSPCSQPQSSPWDLISEARASAPSPHQPWRVSRQVSQAGECWLAPILCVGISPHYLLHPCCCSVLCGSEVLPHTPSVSTSEGAS